jgi:ribosomal protein S18 acetylase RimI-like enzyme
MFHAIMTPEWRILMKIRYTQIEDIPAILAIYNQAKEYLKSQNVNQWQDGYPNEESILSDIKQKQSYVLVENEQVLGTAAIVLELDPNYAYIEDGKWITTGDNYYCIHRIAVDNTIKGKHFANEFVKYAENLAKKDRKSSLRIDTHHQNLSMQKFLHKCGFMPCGTIYLQNGDKRIAFERLL